MMQPRGRPLSHEVQYCLDCAVEQLELSGAAHTVLTLFADFDLMQEWADRPATKAHPRWVRAIELEDYAFELMVDADQQTRDGYVATALLSFHRSLKETMEFYAGWNFEDSTIGGCALAYRRYRLCNEQYQPFKRTARRLHAPGAIRRYVRRAPETPRLRNRARQILSLPWPESPAAARNLLDLVDRQYEDQRRREREAADRMFFNTIVKPPSYSKMQRRRIIRSVNLACGILGREIISRFAAGETVEIHGDQYDFEITRRGKLDQLGHGCLDIAVIARGGPKISKLCFYFDKTPVFDQLAAFFLHVKNGEEKQIIETGNLFNITPDGYNHPLVLERPHRDPVEPDGTRDRWQMLRDAVNGYIVETYQDYEQAILDYTFGREAKRYRAFIALEKKDHRLVFAGEQIQGGEQYAIAA